VLTGLAPSKRGFICNKKQINISRVLDLMEHTYPPTGAFGGPLFQGISFPTNEERLEIISKGGFLTFFMMLFSVHQGFGVWASDLSVGCYGSNLTAVNFDCHHLP
jgi:hypothetical protein